MRFSASRSPWMSPIANVRDTAASIAGKARPASTPTLTGVCPELLDGLERSLHVRTYPQLRYKDVPDNAAPVDDEGRPAGKETQRRPHVVERAHPPVGVAEEGHRQAVLLREGVVRGERVRRDADDRGAGLDERVVSV